VTFGNNKPSLLRRLKNAGTQRFVMAPLLFNIYTSELPVPSPESMQSLTI